MIFKKIKPVTPSIRHTTKLVMDKYYKTFFILKSLVKGKKNKSGRNHKGQLVVRRRGSGNKKNYRNIRFLRTNNLKYIVTSIEHDPNRSCSIASVYDFINKNYFYILSPSGLFVGNILEEGINADNYLGNTLFLSKIPIGAFIHNITSKKKSYYSRSAGAFSKIIEQTKTKTVVELTSGKRKEFVTDEFYASIGLISNEYKFLKSKGKAGRSRWLNKRPYVRGVAMNPVDHPHGGGEGKTSGGRSSVSPWGKSSKS